MSGIRLHRHLVFSRDGVQAFALISWRDADGKMHCQDGVYHMSRHR